jgi:hypothetical protein
MAAASKSPDSNVLHDSEKLSLSASSPAPQEVRHITGFKVSLVVSNPK